MLRCRDAAASSADTLRISIAPLRCACGDMLPAAPFQMRRLLAIMPCAPQHYAAFCDAAMPLPATRLRCRAFALFADAAFFDAMFLMLSFSRRPFFYISFLPRRFSAFAITPPLMPPETG